MTEEYYDVKKLMDKRVREGKTEYKVMWADDATTWEDARTLIEDDCGDLIDAFEKQRSRTKRRKSRSPRASPTRRGRARANSGKSTGVVEEEEEATPAASTRSRASSNASTGSTGAHTTLDTDTHKALEPDAMQTKVSTQLLPLPLVVAVGLLATAANLFLVAGKDFYMLKQPGYAHRWTYERSTRMVASLCFFYTAVCFSYHSSTRRYSALLRGTIVFIGAFFLNTVLEYFGIPTCTTMTTVELPRAILCVLPVSALFGIVLGFRGNPEKNFVNDLLPAAAAAAAVAYFYSELVNERAMPDYIRFFRQVLGAVIATLAVARCVKLDLNMKHKLACVFVAVCCLAPLFTASFFFSSAASLLVMPGLLVAIGAE